MRHKFAVAIAVVILLITYSVVVSQSPLTNSYLEGFRGMASDRVVAEVWKEICAMNRDAYPDSNLVMPGDTILVPMGMKYVAQRTGTRHMWRAAQVFNTLMVQPYLTGDTVSTQNTLIPSSDSNNVQDEIEKSEVLDWLPWVIAVVLALVLVSMILRGRSKSFVANPPSFEGGSDARVRAVAEPALRQAFGNNVRIVGDIERGTATGTLTMFNSDGTTSEESFTNEPAYRAKVRFPDGQERTVVSRWSCFNPVYNRVGARFNGTFTPTGSHSLQRLPVMNDQQVEAMERGIREPERSVTPDDVPAAEGDVVEVQSTTTEVPTPAPKAGPIAAVTGPDGTVHVTKMQVFEKGGFTLEGDLPLTVEQLTNLAYQLTGRHPLDLDAKRPKPVESPKSDADAKSKPVVAHPDDPAHTA